MSHRTTTGIALALAALAAAPAGAQTTYTWTGGTTAPSGDGLWTNPANWANGSVPAGAADAVVVLAGTWQTATVQNRADPLLLTQLNLDPTAASGFSVSGSGLTFGGTAPQIQSDAAATLLISVPVTFAADTAVNLNQNNTAGQELILAGPLAAGSGVRVTVNGGTGIGLAITSANNTGFAGTLGVGPGFAGIVSLGANNAVSRAAVLDLTGLAATSSVRSGTTTATGPGFADAGYTQQVGRVQTTTTTAVGTLQAGGGTGAGTILFGFDDQTATFTGSLATANAASHVAKVGAGVQTVGGGAAFGPGSLSVRGGTLLLQSTSATDGALQNGSGAQGDLTVYAGATLRLNNGTGSANNQNRIGNTADVVLAGGTLRLDANASANSSEIFNRLRLASGESTVLIATQSGRATRFNANNTTAALVPSAPTATVLFAATALGQVSSTGTTETGGVALGSTANLLVGGGGAFGTPTVSVIPFATGSDASTRPAPSSVTASALVGYDGTTNSVRALQAADYATFAAAAATGNVSDGGFAVPAGGATVNAVRLTGDATLTGTLTVTSGALLDVNTAATTVGGGGTLAFGAGGAATAYVTTNTALTLAAPAQAANLAKSGPGTLTVQRPVALGASPVVAVNAGRLALQNDGAAATGGFTAASGAVTYQVSRGATLDVTGVTAGGGFALTGGQRLTGGGTVLGATTVGTGGVLAPSALAGTAGGPGTLTVGAMTWQGGGAYEWSLSSALGGPYTQSLVTSPAGTLDLTGLSAVNRFTVRVASLAPSNAAAAAVYDFDNTRAYTWPVATFGGGVSGFSSDKFTLDASGFAGDLGGGQFSLVAADGNTLAVQFTPVGEPRTLLALAAAGLAAGAAFGRAARGKGRQPRGFASRNTTHDGFPTAA